MKAYEAWIKARMHQRIHRISRPDFSFEKGGAPLIPLASVFGVDFSTDDWEIVKEMKSSTFFSMLEELPQSAPPEVPGGVRLKITAEWEAIKAKKNHNLTFTNIDVDGVIGCHSITRLINDQGLERPHLFTKVYLEWEDL